MKIAHHAIAIDALSEEGFTQIRLKGYGAIRSFFDGRTGVNRWILSVKIKVAARDCQTRPGQCEFWIGANRLVKSSRGLLVSFGIAIRFNRNAAEIRIVSSRVLELIDEIAPRETVPVAELVVNSHDALIEVLVNSGLIAEEARSAQICR